jgi:hypothetical protein
MAQVVEHLLSTYQAVLTPVPKIKERKERMNERKEIENQGIKQVTKAL